MPEDNCECQAYMVPSLPKIKDEQFPKSLLHNLHVLNFGCVNFGTKTYKKFRVKNNKNVN